MKKRDVFLVIVLVGLIVFLAFDLREGGSGISSHIAGVFRMWLFGGSTSSGKPIAVPAALQQKVSEPSAIVFPSMESVPASNSKPAANPDSFRREIELDEMKRVDTAPRYIREESRRDSPDIVTSVEEGRAASRAAASAPTAASAPLEAAAAPQESASQEAASQEAAPQASSPQASSPKEASPRNDTSKAAAPKAAPPPQPPP